MAVLNKEDFMSSLKGFIGERDDDETLAFLQNVNETFDSYSNVEDWKTKYEENDREWRDRYKETFFSGVKKTQPDPEPDPKPPIDAITINELFE